MICDDADIRERPAKSKDPLRGNFDAQATISGTEKMSEIVEGIKKFKEIRT